MPLTRRLQVLLDDARYERLEQRSRETGAPIGELVRRAIDDFLPSGAARARAAADSLLAADPMPVEEWDAMKAQMLDEMHGGGNLG